MGLPLFMPRKAVSASPPRDLTRDVGRLRPIVGPQAEFARGREALALLLWMGAVFVSLALASYAGDPKFDPSKLAEGALPLSGQNWVGMVGEVIARGLVSLLGVVAWVVPIELVLLGIPFVRQRKSLATPLRFAGDFLIALLAAAMVQVALPKAEAFGRYGASGMVGELFGELLRSLFSTAGSFLVGISLLGLILIARASFSFIALLQAAARVSEKSAGGAKSGARSLADAWQRAREMDAKAKQEERERALPLVREDAHEPILATRELDDSPGFDSVPPPSNSAPPPPVKVGSQSAETIKVTENVSTKAPRKRRTPAPADEAPEELAVKMQKLDETPNDFAEVALRGDSPAKSAGVARGGKKRVEEEKTDVSDAPVALKDEADAKVVVVPPVAIEAAPDAKSKRALKEAVPTIVDTSPALKKVKESKKERADRARGFQLPSIDFLVPAKVDPTLSIDRDVLFKNAELLVKTLADYGVQGKVEEILPGPTVTTYEVSPAAGTKVSKVASLADDLALALARKVRILAPIPGKNRIGFELPNERRSPVNLRDLVEDARFRNLDVPLPVVLGRDIVGNPVYADLASMPHVIVAGATGAGKSVGLNVMLASLLYRRTPDDLRLLMIDPKVVELAPFDRIPHMLLPVVTDMKQASNALKWAVDEMERRYQLFADAGTKNITTYNGWVERVIKGEIRNPFPKTVLGKDPNGFIDAVAPEPGEEGEAPLPEKMPFIVIVVDEFADLMMQQGKDVEVAIARLAQKARAAGMHVILATQRPSVDVITGMIKANFPTRIAFRVAQKVDSRTILDEQGAEHLLGRGDMLIRLNGTNETKRVQCPWVSEEEVQLVTDHLRAQGEPVYDENILKPRDDEAAEDEEDSEQDAMYDDAVRIVADTRRCSTSWLQRKLGLGYNRAARIVEMMEKRGIVGPANGAKDREVMVSSL
jgi:DNA segregation ATPase FtsK/SpoIIIE, S-DNA-T family